MTRSPSFVLVLAATLAAAACGDDDPAAPDFGDDVVVELRSQTFEPGVVTIEPGQTVRWVNTSGLSHDVTPNDPTQDGVWQARSTSSSGTVLRHTFEVPGETYAYRCTVHAGMNGIIIVSESTE